MSRLSLVLTIALLSLAPALAHAQSDTSQTFLEFQVEQPVRVKSAATPVYPSHLKSVRAEGQVLVQFVVDERGTPQMASFKVLRSNHNDFTGAVKRAVSATSFYPAQIGNRKVRMLVQQPYTFSVPR